MIKHIIIFTGVIFWTFAAAAEICLQYEYPIEGTSDIEDIPAGYKAEECKSCESDGIYYWNCQREETEAAEDEKSQVNCMDYLRADDAEGFAKCTGLPGKWERRGNQLIRVE